MENTAGRPIQIASKYRHLISVSSGYGREDRRSQPTLCLRDGPRSRFPNTHLEDGLETCNGRVLALLLSLPLRMAFASGIPKSDMQNAWENLSHISSQARARCEVASPGATTRH